MQMISRLTYVSKDAVLRVSEIVQSNVGERVWLTWLVSEFQQESFKIAEVDRCIAGSREDAENDKPPVGTFALDISIQGC